MSTERAKPKRAIAIVLFVPFAGFLSTAGGAASSSQCDAVPGNLIANCGFENPTPLAGWTVDGSFDAHSDINGVTNAIVHSGVRALAIGNYDYEGAAGISQQLTTRAGDAYTVRFYYLNTHPAGYKQMLEATVDGKTVFIDNGATDTGDWTVGTFAFVAAGPHATIGLSAYAGSGRWLIDDIVATGNLHATHHD